MENSMDAINLPHESPCVKVPDEIWFAILKSRRCPAGGFSTAVRLFNGKILEQMIVSDRGYILGRIAPGIAGAHGDMETSILNFVIGDIEAVLLPPFHFWQRPKWIALNPDHPARLAWRERSQTVSK